ncbi:MAG TPA: AEC family transporter, partial [Opitutaceae bacterium]|nr:AEC family transporter [Opitutaceae bacterium]
MTIGSLFSLILPVFAMIAVGACLRRFHFIEEAAEKSLVRLVVSLCMPCLVFDTIVGNPALRDPGNVLLPPLAGFGTAAIGLGVALLAARWIGFGVETGPRTFALSAGVCNYRYLPLPIVLALWGARTQGVVLLFGLGVDMAIWSLGLIILTGASTREGWLRLVSPMLVTLVASVLINLSGLSPHVPGIIGSMARSLGACAVPIGLVMTGVNIANYLDEPAKLFRPNVAVGACAVRLLILPALTLCIAGWLPWSVEMRRV